MSSPLLLALAVSLAQFPDASVEIDGGGVVIVDPADVSADVAWTGNGAKFVWVSDKRDVVYDQARRRGPDLWVNEAHADGGVQWAQGRVLCPTGEGETFSSPRIAANARQTFVAWKVSTLARDEIRGGELLATGVDCARVLYTAPANERLHAIQLEESANTFVLLWESPTNFVTLAVSSPGALIQNVHSKLSAQVAQRIGPSLAPRVGGFYVAWREGINFLGQPLNGLGAAQGTVEQPFLSHVLSAPPVVVGPPLRAVFVSSMPGDTFDTLKAGPIVTSSITQPPSTAPQAQGPLLASAEMIDVMDLGAATSRVLYHQRGDTDWHLTDFSPLSAQSVTVSPGIRPLAMAGAFQRTAVLSAVGDELTVATLTGPTSVPTNLVGAKTRTEPSQLHVSATWLPSGVFSVGYNEGATFKAGSVNPATADRILAPVTYSSDGGVYRMLPREEGQRLAATIESAAGSALVVGDIVQGRLDVTPLLTVARTGMWQGVAGANVGVLWEPGSTYIAHGTGNRQVLPQGLLTFGRCGAKVDDRLLVPAVSDDKLYVLVVEDALQGPTPVGWPVALGARDIAPPCLVARDRELLILAEGSDHKLRLWTVTLDDVLNGAAARELAGFPTRPGNRDVRNPVAVGTHDGWQLAFESVDTTGGHIAELKLSDQFQLVGGNDVSNGLDDRSPTLAISDRDDVLLVWQQFVDAQGTVIVRTRRLAQPTEVDGGVIDAGTNDAGEPMDDGGVGSPDAGETDAGTSTSDGGVQLAPVKFTACGCQGAGGPAVFALALLLVATRRRRA